MRIAIVGGNSQVGTEVAFHLREWGHEVRPVVRNELAAAFLDRHDFECAVADVTDSEGARSALEEVDVVVVAAYAPPFSGEIDDPRTARKTNEAMIRNAVRCTPADARTVYFSTISAYGGDLYTTGSSWRLYAREKRYLESFTLETADEAGKLAYPLRLGLVVGPNQDRTQRIRNSLAGEGSLRVPIAPDKPTNVLHTVTLSEAVVRCGEGRPDPDVYTVVNEPQWTWRELLESYAPAGRTFSFADAGGGGGGSSPVGTALSLGASVVKRYKNYLIPYQVYLPTWFNRRVIHFFRKRNVSGDIAGYRARNSLDIEEFSHRPLAVDDPIPDLTETATLLEDHPTFDDVFARRRIDEGATAPEPGATEG